jgi:hypothetical protein
MRTEITRPKYERKCLGYSSNLSDAEWTTIEPLLPQRNRLGRPPKTSPSAGVIDSHRSRPLRPRRGSIQSARSRRRDVAGRGSDSGAHAREIEKNTRFQFLRV